MRKFIAVSLWRKFRREDSLTQGATALMVGMFVVFFVVVALLLAGCGRPLPGERPGPDRPTIGPTFPFQPQNRHFLLGVVVRNTDGAIMAGRIAVTADAVDAKGGRGTPAGGSSRFPMDATVDSGWMFPFDVPPNYPLDIHVVLTATVVGLEAGERVECSIVEDTGLNYVYFDEGFARAPRQIPHQPLTAHCEATIPGVPAG